MDYIKISVKNEANDIRTPVIINIDGDVHFLALTDDQVALMKWLNFNFIDQYVDEDIFNWNLINPSDFKEIK